MKAVKAENGCDVYFSCIYPQHQQDSSNREECQTNEAEGGGEGPGR
jgi:hypothetical protein